MYTLSAIISINLFHRQICVCFMSIDCKSSILMSLECVSMAKFHPEMFKYDDHYMFIQSKYQYMLYLKYFKGTIIYTFTSYSQIIRKKGMKRIVQIFVIQKSIKLFGIIMYTCVFI